jgi:hypothetical protein
VVDPSADAWIRAHVEPTGAIEAVHERTWATVWRIPTDAGAVFFKACAAVQLRAGPDGRTLRAMAE